MDGLDQLALSRILGSTVRPYSRSGFGGFSATRSVGEMLAARPKPPIKLAPDSARDAKIIDAFSATHQGYSVDRTLADPVLTSQFVKRCRKLGVDAPQSAICRRLLRMRKEGGILNGLTTVQDDRDLWPFLIPAELAFAQLTYRHDASYDDLLADPEIGEAFDALADKIGHGKGGRVDYRLAALHLRKNVRARRGGEAEKLAQISLADIERRWHPLGTLSSVSPDAIPTTDGLLSLSEPRRHLFLTKYPDLRAGVATFQDKRLLSAIGNSFWSPSPEAISLRVMTPKDVKRAADLRLYEMKSLEVYRPILNMLPTAA